MICRKDITVRKVWNDKENAYGKRPVSIEVNLLRDGEIYKNATINSVGIGTHTFKCLPIWNGFDLYDYKVEELTVSGYKTSINEYIITNTLETITINCTKIWNDNDNATDARPDSITVYLLQDGQQVDLVDLTIAPDENTVSFDFNDVPFADTQGRPYVYTIKEKEISGYMTVVDGFTLTNELIENP